MIECKCKDCEKRHPGCHSDCPDYILFRKKVEEEKEMRKKERAVVHTVEYKDYISGIKRLVKKGKRND